MDRHLLYIIVPFCSLFILIGGWGMVSAGRNIALGIQAQGWSQTTGRVLSVESKDTSDSDCHSREIRVRYLYDVDGREYEGTTIHPTYGSSSFEEAHRGLESVLRPETRVRVYYDDGRPDRSTLSAGFYSSSLAMFFFGFTFFFAGLGFLLIFWFAIAGDWDFARGITVLP